MSEGFRRWKPQPSTVIAMVALFVALAGSAYAAKIGANKVKSKHIKDGQVKTNDLADLAVTTVKLADGSVSTAKILDATVGTADLADNAVNSAKVAADSLTAADLAANSVNTSELADNAVNSAKVAANTLTDADLAADSVGSSEIQTDAVNATEIANDSIDSGEVADGGLNDVDVGIASGTLVFDPPNVGANSCLFSGAVPLAGVSLGDHVLITPPDSFATLDVTLQGTVLSAGNLRINTCNGTNVAQNAPSGSFSVLVFNQ